MYKFYKRATSRDGKLDVDNRQYGMQPEFLQEFGNEMMGKGCATCIFVKLDGGPAKEVVFETDAGYQEVHPLVDGWAHSSMYNPGSGYNADNKKGPWRVYAKDFPSEVVDDIGLPYGWHVTHYIVFKWEEGDEQAGGEEGEGPEPVEPGESLKDYPLRVTLTTGNKHYEGYVREVRE